MIEPERMIQSTRNQFNLDVTVTRHAFMNECESNPLSFAGMPGKYLDMRKPRHAHDGYLIRFTFFNKGMSGYEIDILDEKQKKHPGAAHNHVFLWLWVKCITSLPSPINPGRLYGRHPGVFD